MAGADPCRIILQATALRRARLGLPPQWRRLPGGQVVCDHFLPDDEEFAALVERAA